MVLRFCESHPRAWWAEPSRGPAQKVWNPSLPAEGVSPTPRPHPQWLLERRLSPGDEGRIEIIAFISCWALKLGEHRARPTGLGRRQCQLHRRLQVLLTAGAQELGTGLPEQGVRLPCSVTVTPWDALVSPDPLSEGLWRQTCPLCLPPCPPRFRPGLPTSPSLVGSPEALWVWAGPCPPNFSSSAFSLRRRRRGERRK